MAWWVYLVVGVVLAFALLFITRRKGKFVPHHHRDEPSGGKGVSEHQHTDLNQMMKKPGAPEKAGIEKLMETTPQPTLEGESLLIDETAKKEPEKTLDFLTAVQSTPPEQPIEEPAAPQETPATIPEEAEPPKKKAPKKRKGIPPHKPEKPEPPKEKFVDLEGLETDIDASFLEPKAKPKVVLNETSEEHPARMYNKGFLSGIIGGKEEVKITEKKDGAKKHCMKAYDTGKNENVVVRELLRYGLNRKKAKETAKRMHEIWEEKRVPLIQKKKELEVAIKETELKYSKRQIDEATLRSLVNGYQKDLIETEAKLKGTEAYFED